MTGINNYSYNKKTRQLKINHEPKHQIDQINVMAIRNDDSLSGGYNSLNQFCDTIRSKMQQINNINASNFKVEFSKCLVSTIRKVPVDWVGRYSDSVYLLSKTI